jgi:hypothetical protein
MPSSSTGTLVSAATPDSDKRRSRWISGSSGGTASSVMRKSAPASHRRTRRHGIAAVYNARPALTSA